jgi:hypothetical protein
MVDIDTCLLMVKIYQKILSLQDDLDAEKAYNPPDYDKIHQKRAALEAVKSLLK